MQICDICGSKYPEWKCEISTPPIKCKGYYDICNKCAKKLIKYIKFEKSRCNQHGEFRVKI